MNRRGFFQTIAGAAVAVRQGDWAAFKRVNERPPITISPNFDPAKIYSKAVLKQLQKKFVYRDMHGVTFESAPFEAPTFTVTWPRVTPTES